jgi:hypothetical protein
MNMAPSAMPPATIASGTNGIALATSTISERIAVAGSHSTQFAATNL